MQAIIQIRDPIFDYIPVTEIEREIIDKPEFQRLRFVLENSTALLTYPGNTNTRFLHSLGTMHLAGELYSHSLNNACGATLKSFAEQCKTMCVGTATNKLQMNEAEAALEWRELYGNIARINHSPFWGQRVELSGEQLLWINVIWQAVRIAALLHDLGHLAMSHVFEEALNEYWSEAEVKGSAVAETYMLKIAKFSQILETMGRGPEDLPDGAAHEVLGLSLFYRWFPQPGQGLALKRLVYALAKSIWLQNTKATPKNSIEMFFQCLHSIIDGEIDADRLDYCLRDPWSAGLEQGAFDIRRILNNMVLHMGDDGNMRVLVHARAASAVETFLYQRFLIYKYLIYHHNVARMDGIVKEIIKRLLKFADDGYLPLKDILRAVSFWNPSAQPSERFLPGEKFYMYDDCWLRTVFYVVHQEIKGRTEAQELFLLLDTFLFRKKENVVSLWKREMEFYNDLMEFSKAGELLHNPELVYNLNMAGPAWKETIEGVRQELKQRGIILIHKTLKAKTFEFLEVLIGPNQTKVATEFSPYLGSLKESMGRLNPLHISLVAENIKSTPRGEGDNIIDECKKIVLSRLLNYATIS